MVKCCAKSSAAGVEETGHGPDAKDGGTDGGRVQWSSPTEFLLTCIGYSVGLGNVWRFPYLCYKSGGGAFLIPYIIMMVLIGMPLLFMEYAFGQFFGVGGLTIFKKVCPMLQGVGIGYMVLNGLVCIYYNVIIATALYYLFASFTADLPWGKCDNAWNTPNCGDPTNLSLVTTSTVAGAAVGAPVATTTVIPGNLTALNGTALVNETMPNVTSLLANVTGINSTKSSPSSEYFKLALMDMHEEHSVSNIGEVRWHLCLCLLLAWVLVVIFVSRGIQSTGKVAYFTATFPYLMLTVLVVRGATLEGATSGILYFVTPVWSKLKDPSVWFGAATQLFYSTNLAWGGMITMSSYNTFTHNCYRDAIMINLVSFFTSLYAGFAVFSIIGFMAHEQNMKIEDVIDSGPGLAFIVYPRALSLMPLAPMWSALFFFMLFLLGIGSQMVLVETVVTGFCDEFPVLAKNACKRLMTTIAIAIFFFVIAISQTTQMVQVETLMTGIVDKYKQLNRTKWTRLLTVIVVCAAGYLMGLPCTTQGGMYVLQLMDHYSATFGCLIIAVVECIAINWLYGNEKFAANVKEMLGHYPKLWWRICWKYISPVIIFGILLFSFVKYKPAEYGSYRYPLWADIIGWCMALASVIPIFVVMALSLYRANGSTFKEKFQAAIQPKLDRAEAPASAIEEKFLPPSKQKEPDTLEIDSEADAQKHSLMDTSTV